VGQLGKLRAICLPALQAVCNLVNNPPFKGEALA